MTARILVSACLVGRPVRYDGTAKTLRHALIEQWHRESRLVVVCPEAAAGFPTPRPPAEIVHAPDQVRRVHDATGADLTAFYDVGAEAALALARVNGCRFALLMDGSPSCGSGFIHDGSFTGRRIIGAGITAALLRAHGIAVFAPAQIEALQVALQG